MLEYSAGYKYQLEKDHTCMTPVKNYSIYTDYFRIEAHGRVTVFRGYCWDGASGPTFDSQDSMVPSLYHDVFCQCLRNGTISYERWQDVINLFFYHQCLACGMHPIRAKLWYWGVEFGDAGNPKHGPDRIVHLAPSA